MTPGWVASTTTRWTAARATTGSTAASAGTCSTGGPGADDIDGGADGTDVATIERHDLVDYGDRTASVFVDLQVTGAQGEQGENQTLRGHEVRPRR